MGPYESKCPKGIIDLLSPTESEYAKEWRKRCLDFAKTKSMRDLPVGAIFQFEDYSGKIVKLIKCAPAYQFKTVWYRYFDKNMYYPKKDIPWEKVEVL